MAVPGRDVIEPRGEAIGRRHTTLSSYKDQAFELRRRRSLPPLAEQGVRARRVCQRARRSQVRLRLCPAIPPVGAARHHVRITCGAGAVPAVIVVASRNRCFPSELVSSGPSARAEIARPVPASCLPAEFIFLPMLRPFAHNSLPTLAADNSRWAHRPSFPSAFSPSVTSGDQTRCYKPTPRARPARPLPHKAGKHRYTHSEFRSLAFRPDPPGSADAVDRAACRSPLSAYTRRFSHTYFNLIPNLIAT